MLWTSSYESCDPLWDQREHDQLFISHSRAKYCCPLCEVVKDGGQSQCDFLLVTIIASFVLWPLRLPWDSMSISRATPLGLQSCCVAKRIMAPMERLSWQVCYMSWRWCLQCPWTIWLNLWLAMLPAQHPLTHCILTLMSAWHYHSSWLHSKHIIKYTRIDPPLIIKSYCFFDGLT